MTNLTSQQASDLSNFLLELNKSIEDFRFDPNKKLSDSQKQNLDNYMDQISDCGQKILALSVTLAMDDVQMSLTKIENISKQINSTLKTLKDIQKGIEVAGSVAALGLAIIDKNTQNIGSAISGIYNTWNTK